MKKRETKLATESIKIAAIVGLVASLGAAMTGHKSAQSVSEVQPMKLAAMEALYEGGPEQGLAIIPGVKVPYALSFMATNDFAGYVPGINDILNGYAKSNGTIEPSVDEKIERGKRAITALADYRKAKKEGASDSILNAQLSTINANMQYFGYGYVKDRNDIVPPVWINFWAFRIMVGLGCLFGSGLSVHPVLCRHPGRHLQVPQGLVAEVRHHRPTLLALLGGHSVSATGLYRL